MVIDPLNQNGHSGSNGAFNDNELNHNEEALDNKLRSATKSLNQGDLQGAQLQYLRVLETFGESSKILMALGLIEGQLGDLRSARARFLRVTQINAKELYAWRGLAMCQQNLGETGPAIHSFLQLINLLTLENRFIDDPDHKSLLIESLEQINNLETKSENYERALDFARKSYSIDANISSGILLAKALIQCNYFSDAIDFLNETSLIYPGDDSLFVLKGLALEKLRTSDLMGVEALQILDCYDKAILLNPKNPQAYYLKANILSSLEKWSDALESYELALVHKPNDLLSLNNVLVVYQAMGNYELANSCVEWFMNLISQDPSLLDQLNQGLAPFYFNAGALSILRYEYTLARKYFELALAENPLYPQLLGAYLHLRMRLCDWHSSVTIKEKNSTVSIEFESLRELALNAVKEALILVHPFALLSLTDDKHLHQLASREWCKLIVKNNKNLILQNKFNLTRSGKSQKIRIGYFSCDFKEHATAYLMASFFELHDRHNFEIIAYSWSSDDKSQMRNRLLRSFDKWFEVGSLTDSQTIELARSHELDIAIDLKGYTDGARTAIFAARVAPVQIAYLGYPGTMDAPFMDFCIADQTIVNEELELNMGEKVLFMPFSYQVNDLQRSISSSNTKKYQHGLPDNGIIFCSFNSTYKITEDIFRRWVHILKATPSSVLWLLEDNTVARINLCQQALTLGLNTDRLIFAPRLPHPEHLERISHADLFLDTFPCNAHTTASDALWAGVPILTLMGNSFASRVAASLLTHVGLKNLIAQTPNQYVELACELAQNPHQLSNIKNSLLNAKRNGQLALFDTVQFTRDFEKILQSICK